MFQVVEARNAPEREQALAIRRSVFVHEQGVPLDLEIDEYDAQSRHYLVVVDGVAAGTARIRHTPRGLKIERVAVLASHRGRGVGTAIVREILAGLGKRNGTSHGKPVYVHAQVSALEFWKRLGFVGEGDVFDEAGIAHQVMRLETPRPHHVGA